MVARVFFAISAAFALALLIWAAILFLVGDDSGTFPAAFSLWLATGLPFTVAGLFARAYRRRRSSARPPAHWFDGYR